MSDTRYYQNTSTLNQIAAPTSSVSLNSQLITNLANPVNNQDAATKLSVFNDAGRYAPFWFRFKCGDIPSGSGALSSNDFSSSRSIVTGIVKTSFQNNSLFTVSIDQNVISGTSYIVCGLGYWIARTD